VPKRTPETASSPIDWSSYRRQDDELSAANITDLVLTGIAAIIAIAGD
jgi:hypothetical protein